jgi:hypothetical protein
MGKEGFLRDSQLHFPELKSPGNEAERMMEAGLLGRSRDGMAEFLIKESQGSPWLSFMLALIGVFQLS